MGTHNGPYAVYRAVSVRWNPATRLGHAPNPTPHAPHPPLHRYKLAKTFANTAGLGKISADFKAELEDFMPIMPLVTSLRNPGMRARHWTELTKVTGKDMEVCPKDEFTLTTCT